MIRELSLAVLPEEDAGENILKDICARECGIPSQRISGIRKLKRSIDARSRTVRIQLKLEVYIDEPAPAKKTVKRSYPDVSAARPVLIIGCGPAGMFAALRLIELGRKPIILERGKDVRSRRRDLAALNRMHIVNPDSNYCFGEGGAGTYSDGKLYTRSTKRGDVIRILETLVAHGADENILVEAHPHIGTNKLPKIIVSMRESILNAGGEIHFNTRLTDLLTDGSGIKGVIAGSKEFTADSVILATGHSARDIFELLGRKNILIEAKPFALGVRVEHQQKLIDSIQYHTVKRHPLLPPAAYSLAEQVNGKGVFSFCMCPGGIIAPCATEPGEIVTNGWSPSKRNNPYSNSGIVVAVDEKEWQAFSKHGALAALRYQQAIEKDCFVAGGRTQAAPAQRMLDFCTNKLSPSLPETSYQPGITSYALHELLPPGIAKRLQTAFRLFERKMKGYYTNEAVLHAVESRTSSPVRIPRDKETLQHPQVKGLYPCGEGAGYAGGIVSAAIDGEKCAEALCRS
ncbi:MAG: FAD-dependent protein [Bacteroidota bacterium]